MKKKLKFNSRAIHGGQILDPAYGSVMTPIYQTSTYAQTSPGVHKGYEYSRTHNPTRTNFERSIASLTAFIPELCPKNLSLFNFLAHLPLPSMIMAT